MVSRMSNRNSHGQMSIDVKFFCSFQSGLETKRNKLRKDRHYQPVKYPWKIQRELVFILIGDVEN